MKEKKGSSLSVSSTLWLCLHTQHYKNNENKRWHFPNELLKKEKTDYIEMCVWFRWPKCWSYRRLNYTINGQTSKPSISAQRQKHIELESNANTHTYTCKLATKEENLFEKETKYIQRMSHFVFTTTKNFESCSHFRFSFAAFRFSSFLFQTF